MFQLPAFNLVLYVSVNTQYSSNVPSTYSTLMNVKKVVERNTMADPNRDDKTPDSGFSSYPTVNSRESSARTGFFNNEETMPPESILKSPDVMNVTEDSFHKTSTGKSEGFHT